MPMTSHRIRIKSFAVGLFYKSLVGLFVLLILGSYGTALRAQTIKIKLVNGRNGRPMVGKCVNVWVGTERVDALSVPTDKQGIASLVLTHQGAEINTQNQWPACGMWGVDNPVLKYADKIRINAGYVLCQLHKPGFSWLAIMTFSTKEVLQSGIVTKNTCGKAKASPKPGEIILFVRPLNFWEKLRE